MKEYRGEDWEIQRRKAMKKDNNKCRKCPEIKNLGTHHIIPFKISHSNHLTNLITLCPKHHKKEDNKFLTIGITHYLVKMMVENVKLSKEMK